jgi:NAD(P)-dependent dehydrogenase (short-subunit alcohol dehydrogenase family)
MKTALITGSNRGIGLELCRQLANRGERVIATCRHSSEALDALAAEHPERVTVLPDVDVSSAASVEQMATSLESVARIDWLILNAGIALRDDRPAAPDFDGIKTQFEVNAVGALRSAIALLPKVPSGGKIAFVTSRMGSIGDNSSGGYYGYRMSKAALNIAAVSLARDLARRAISVAILHPGWVKTDMNDGHGQMEADDSARGLIARIDELGASSSGTFWHANGELLPW